MLLETKSIDIDLKDQQNNTAAHCAAMYGKFKALRTLVRSGARLCQRNDENNYPFHDAITHKVDVELFKLVLIETDK